MASKAYRYQNCAADCHFDGVCCASSLEIPGRNQHGLSDENQKVRTITALLLAALAEAAAPYGIASFDSVADVG